MDDDWFADWFPTNQDWQGDSVLNTHELGRRARAEGWEDAVSGAPQIRRGGEGSTAYQARMGQVPTVSISLVAGYDLNHHPSPHVWTAVIGGEGRNYYKIYPSLGEALDEIKYNRLTGYQEL
jgi:hypothetical protein